jgi:hypothetical protein
MPPRSEGKAAMWLRLNRRWGGIQLPNAGKTSLHGEYCSAAAFALKLSKHWRGDSAALDRTFAPTAIAEKQARMAAYRFMAVDIGDSL